MRLPRIPTNTILTGAALLLAATPGPAAATVRTKSCKEISNCATTVTSTPPPQAVLGAPPNPTSHFGVAVRTPPTATLGQAPTAGKLVTNAQVGRRIRCPGYRLRAPATFEFQLLTATPVNITYEITDRITDTTATGIQFCLAATFAFKTASGRPARAARLPDGTRGHVGLLPPCPKPLPPAGLATAPCIANVTTAKDKNSSTGVDVILRIRVPTRTKGDPWGAG